MTKPHNAYKLSMSDTQHGENGQHHLIRGERGSLRLWHNEQPDTAGSGDMHQHDYETLGYIISGRAELSVNDQKIMLEAGDSYCVPSNTPHMFRILETLTAVESTTPSAF